MRRADVGKKSHLLTMRQAQGARTRDVLPGVRRDEAKAMAQVSSANARATPEAHRADDRARLLVAWQTQEEAPPTLRRRQQRTPPPRLLASMVRHLALPSLPPETARSQAQEAAPATTVSRATRDS